jgi:uncharacterized protein YgiM (DUF1202 family)
MLKALMSGRGMLMAATFGVLMLLGAAAHADEVVRLNTEANLRARPGERAPTLAKLDEGQTVRVIGRSGRWIKVTYKGKVGWLTRTQVDEDEGVSARPTADKKRTGKGMKARKGWSDDEMEEGEDAVEEDEEAAPPKKSKKVAKAAPKKSQKGKKAAKKAARKAMPTEGDEVVTTKAVTLRKKPSKKGAELWEADEGASMKVIAVSDDGQWLRVQDEDGEKGWLAAKDVAMVGGGDEDAEEVGDDEDIDAEAERAIGADDEDDDEDVDDEDGDEPRKVAKKGKKKGGKKGMNIWAHGNVGILSKSQTYASGGTGLRANYALANTAPAGIVGIGLAKDMGSYTLGVEVDGVITVGGEGIKVSTGAGDGGGNMMGGETLSWSALEINARGTVGYAWNKKKGYAVQGRLGYHTSSVTVAVSDTAKLPSERLSGFLVGAGVLLPKLTDKIGVSLSADYLAGGSLEQTEGLRDGDSSAVSAFFVGAQGAYSIRPKMDIHAYYQLSLEGFGFAGTNQREATATNAKRSDQQHVIGVGLSYLF